ncbi:PepSY domain-containing protein [Pseudoalteromonas sp. SSDWG2]|uniref:PepSY domain-containing protein n=1 Tax=Pseudoalteromonas sp. SSDWG2 TaxID=3139391 RepID=UPI003BA9A791
MFRIITALFMSLALCIPNAYSQDSKAIDKKQAVAIAKQKEDGKVLKITEQKDTFIVRILKPKGRVIDIIVSKHTGQVEKEKF